MRSVRLGIIVAVAALAVTTFSAYAGWFRDESPPANSKPLSEILKGLEDQGYKVITEVSFDDGKWEVEVHQANGKELEFHIDPISGRATPG